MNNLNDQERNKILDENFKVLGENHKVLDENSKILDKNVKILDENHKLLSQEKGFLYKKIKDFKERYVDGCNPKVVYLDGEWGSGKTFFIDEYIKRSNIKYTNKSYLFYFIVCILLPCFIYFVDFFYLNESIKNISNDIIKSYSLKPIFNFLITIILPIIISLYYIYFKSNTNEEDDKKSVDKLKDSEICKMISIKLAKIFFFILPFIFLFYTISYNYDYKYYISYFSLLLVFFSIIYLDNNLNNKNYDIKIKISLFNLKNKDELEDKVFNEILNNLRGYGISNSLSSKLDFRLNLVFFSFGGKNDVFVSFIKNNVFNKYLSNSIIFFDDIERKNPNLSIKEFYGFINELKEKYKTKTIVLVSNKNKFADFSDEDKKYIKDYNEKIINLNYNFSYNYEEILKIINNKEISFKNDNIKEKDNVKKINDIINLLIKENNITNLRSIENIYNFFNIIFKNFNTFNEIKFYLNVCFNVLHSLINKKHILNEDGIINCFPNKEKNNDHVKNIVEKSKFKNIVEEKFLKKIIIDDLEFLEENINKDNILDIIISNNLFLVNGYKPTNCEDFIALIINVFNGNYSYNYTGINDEEVIFLLGNEKFNKMFSILNDVYIDNIKIEEFKVYLKKNDFNVLKFLDRYSFNKIHNFFSIDVNFRDEICNIWFKKYYPDFLKKISLKNFIDINNLAKDTNEKLYLGEDYKQCLNNHIDLIMSNNNILLENIKNNVSDGFFKEKSKLWNDKEKIDYLFNYLIKNKDEETFKNFIVSLKDNLNEKNFGLFLKSCDEIFKNNLKCKEKIYRAILDSNKNIDFLNYLLINYQSNDLLFSMFCCCNNKNIFFKIFLKNIKKYNNTCCYNLFLENINYFIKDNNLRSISDILDSNFKGAMQENYYLELLNNIGFELLKNLDYFVEIKEIIINTSELKISNNIIDKKTSKKIKSINNIFFVSFGIKKEEFENNIKNGDICYFKNILINLNKYM